MHLVSVREHDGDRGRSGRLASGSVRGASDSTQVHAGAFVQAERDDRGASQEKPCLPLSGMRARERSTDGRAMRHLVGRHVAAWLVAGVAGSLMFWGVQILAGGPTLTAFMGDQILSTRGYTQGLSSLVCLAGHRSVRFS